MSALSLFRLAFLFLAAIYLALANGAFIGLFGSAPNPLLAKGWTVICWSLALVAFGLAVMPWNAK